MAEEGTTTKTGKIVRTAPGGTNIEVRAMNDEVVFGYLRDEDDDKIYLFWNLNELRNVKVPHKYYYKLEPVKISDKSKSDTIKVAVLQRKRTT